MTKSTPTLTQSGLLAVLLQRQRYIVFQLARRSAHRKRVRAAFWNTLTPNSGNRFTTTFALNILTGFNQMANPLCAILTRRASSNCSTHLPKENPTSLSLIYHRVLEQD
jgi:hypothetical protein